MQQQKIFENVHPCKHTMVLFAHMQWKKLTVLLFQKHALDMTWQTAKEAQ